MSGAGSGAKTALVIGGGPAGLMAAGVLARAGLAVTLADRMPSLGRKFLMAGKSGLNLTRDEPPEPFLAHYAAPAPVIDAVGDFESSAVQAWARGLGQALFTGSTGRVFPEVMKASPLLRAWLAELRGLGVEMRVHWRWRGMSGGMHLFETPEGSLRVRADVCVLAMGGASWKRLGSDGAWAQPLARYGVDIVPFAASNAGLSVDWSPAMARVFGAPVKGCAIHAAGRVHRGEMVIAASGLEGGGIYALSPAVRAGVPLTLDLMPDWPVERIAAQLSKAPAKVSLSNVLRRALRMDPARMALLREFGGVLPRDGTLAPLIKALPLRHRGLRPLDEAISTVGGVAAGEIGTDLMLRASPGIFVAGEMIDWDAPTGGYLITGCLATGRLAGRSAAAFASPRGP